MPSVQEVEYYRNIFRAVTDDKLSRFSYIKDKDAFGELDVWTGLRSRHGRLWGDCEDLVIEVLNECYLRGIPLDAMYLHYVIIPDIGGHAVGECCGLIADCNQASTVWRSSIGYYDWVSHRRLDWVRPEHS